MVHLEKLGFPERTPSLPPLSAFHSRQLHYVYTATGLMAALDRLTFHKSWNSLSYSTLYLLLFF